MQHKRINRSELFMGLAILSSKRSLCQRLQVGAVLVKDNRIIANSYNGLLPGNLDTCYLECNIDKPCTKTLHAEENLIAFCAKEAIPMNNCSVYITHSPCKKCLNLLTQAGIKKIIYNIPYRNSEHLLNTLVSIGQFSSNKTLTYK